MDVCLFDRGLSTWRKVWRISTTHRWAKQGRVGWQSHHSHNHKTTELCTTGASHFSYASKFSILSQLCCTLWSIRVRSCKFAPCHQCRRNQPLCRKGLRIPRSEILQQFQIPTRLALIISVKRFGLSISLSPKWIFRIQSLGSWEMLATAPLSLACCEDPTLVNVTIAKICDLVNRYVFGVVGSWTNFWRIFPKFEPGQAADCDDTIRPFVYFSIYCIPMFTISSNFQYRGNVDLTTLFFKKLNAQQSLCRYRSSAFPLEVGANGCSPPAKRLPGARRRRRQKFWHKNRYFFNFLIEHVFFNKFHALWDE